MVAALSILVIVDCCCSGSSPSSTFSLSCVVYEGFSSIDIRLSPEEEKNIKKLEIRICSLADGKVGGPAASKYEELNHLEGRQNKL